VRSTDPFYLEHKEKLLLLAAGALLALAFVPQEPIPESDRLVLREGQTVAEAARTADVADVRSFVRGEIEYYWDERRSWVFVQEAVKEVRTAVDLPLPKPYVPKPPWPLPTPGPLLRFTGNQPRLGEPLEDPEIPGLDEGDAEGGVE